MKIVELLTFFNEVDLLKVHLEEHWDYVDKFIVTEAANSYATHAKPYHLEPRLGELKPYMDKLVYEKLETSYIFFQGDPRLAQDLQQYSPLIKYPEIYTQYDYCLHNDLDEIIDRRHWPRLLERVKEHNNPKQVRFYLRHFRNYLNWEFPDFKYEVFRLSRLADNPKFLRPGSKLDYLSLFNDEPYGYHFTFMGGPDNVKYKLKNFMHHGNITKEVLEAEIRPDQYSLYWRDDPYGAPKVLANPKAEMPKYMQDNWEFFQTWVQPLAPVAPPPGAPSKRRQKA